MPIRRFKVEDLKEMGLPYYAEVDEVEIVSDEITGTSRWSIFHELIFRYEDKYYRCDYSVGATEMQYEAPWEYETEIDCHEVHLVEHMVEVWEDID